MRYQHLKYRRLDPAEAERLNITCGVCRERAAWCNERQTESMAAPGFYYLCDDDAARAAKLDGIPNLLTEGMGPRYGPDVKLEELTAKGSMQEAAACLKEAARLTTKALAYVERATNAG